MKTRKKGEKEIPLKNGDTAVFSLYEGGDLESDKFTRLVSKKYAFEVVRIYKKAAKAESDFTEMTPRGALNSFMMVEALDGAMKYIPDNGGKTFVFGLN